MYEYYYILYNDWDIIKKNWSMPVYDAFDLIGWPNDGGWWFKYMIATYWQNWTFDEWLKYHYIDRTVIINPANNLNSCLNMMNSDEINILLNSIKRFYANMQKANLNDNLGFVLSTAMFESCQFNQQICHSENFTSFWSNEYGRCYTFNDGKHASKLRLGKSGADYGLKMTLKVCK